MLGLQVSQFANQRQLWTDLVNGSFGPEAAVGKNTPKLPLIHYPLACSPNRAIYVFGASLLGAIVCCSRPTVSSTCLASKFSLDPLW